MPRNEDLSSLINSFSVNDVIGYTQTGCLSWDLLTAGKGLAMGISHLWSSVGYGKSTLMLSVARSLSKKGKKTLYVSIEPNQDLAQAMGLMNDSNFSLISLVYYGDLETVFRSFVESDYTLLVVDSITACISKEMGQAGYNVEKTHIAYNARIRALLVHPHHTLS
ncbi:unnamed protein product, partial [marine sediment metagenome]